MWWGGNVRHDIAAIAMAASLAGCFGEAPRCLSCPTPYEPDWCEPDRLPPSRRDEPSWSWSEAFDVLEGLHTEVWEDRERIDTVSFTVVPHALVERSLIADELYFEDGRYRCASHTYVFADVTARFDGGDVTFGPVSFWVGRATYLVDHVRPTPWIWVDGDTVRMDGGALKHDASVLEAEGIVPLDLIAGDRITASLRWDERGRISGSFRRIGDGYAYLQGPKVRFGPE